MTIRIRPDGAARSGVWQQREKQPHSAERQRHFSRGARWRAHTLASMTQGKTPDASVSVVALGNAEMPQSTNTSKRKSTMERGPDELSFTKVDMYFTTVHLATRIL